MSDAGSLKGLRVLVVEDQALVAMEIENLLMERGCEVVGPASTVEVALRCVKTRQIDGALLDVNLQGKDVLPVAEELQKRGTPFILVTGYPSRETDVPIIRAARRIKKPFVPSELVAAMAEVFAPEPAALP